MKTRTSLILCVVAVLGLVAVQPAQAAILYWDTNGATAGACPSGNTAPGTWDSNTTANWTTSSAGTVATQTYGGVTNQAIFAAGTDATGSYTVTVSGTVPITSGTGASAGLKLEEGNVTLTGGIISPGSGNANYGIDVATSSTLTINSQWWNNAAGSNQGLTKSGAGTVIMNGSYVNVSAFTITGGTWIASTTSGLPGTSANKLQTVNGGTLGFRIGGSGWTTAQVDTRMAYVTKTSGAFGIDTTNGDLAQWTAFTTTNFGASLGLVKLGSNTFTLTYANTYAGPTTVGAGTLLVNNTTGSGTSTGAVTVSSGATLGGGGSIGGAVNVLTGGILAPGASLGTLTVANNVTLSGDFLVDVETDGTSDLLAVTGDLTLGGSLTIANLSKLVSPVYTIATYTGSLGGSSFASTNLGTTGYIVDTTSTPGSVLLVPEPATLALMALGGLGLILGRKRK